jgi:predicted RNA-binding protein with TRAM domain
VKNLENSGGRRERDTFSNSRRKGGSGSQKRDRVTTIVPGQEFEVKIEKVGHKGDGMVTIEGMVVFIKNVEVGEEVRVKINKVLDTVAFADRLN